MKVSIHRKLAMLTLSLATMLLFAGALLVSPMDAQAGDFENITGKLAVYIEKFNCVTSSTIPAPPGLK